MEEKKLKNLDEIGKKIKKLFENEDRIREESLRITREITRISKKSISELHKGRYKFAERYINKAIEELNILKKKLKKYPEIYYAGFLHLCEKEVIEAIISLYLIRKKEIPRPEKYNFDLISFLHGLSESTGELRRYILDNIRKGKIDGIEDYLEIMDIIYNFLLNFNYPENITRSLRRQIDYVRGIVERTRSDITYAIVKGK